MNEITLEFSMNGLNNILDVPFDKSVNIGGSSALKWSREKYGDIFVCIENNNIVLTISAIVDGNYYYWTIDESVADNVASQKNYIRISLQDIFKKIN